ncbi:globin domain-containing protein [Stackebrandtia nassauensis]|uniref:nitric oxide dioxygenase n=1 Tax=Stackebrandtia nassauensis (strain DSM 44728 / CIP 108903 / NRRL B-16338 / NBRC 102104 / LLR-40K-21) TaxID=446470 RepID=D3Q2U1_STANL|nr:globin domain-containing protein [Stackebrandtia nassauensis]ADD45842.1 oxidoreductase FAD/NAD(P)-binding domain protein [Stackebrandtia nassauensis DSM 44728]
MVDADRLKANWELVASHGGQVPLFFYSTLFLTHPETRQLFPVSMAGQRDKLVRALGAVVSSVDDLDAVVPYLKQLGRDHRKFGAVRDHYPAVGAALLATLEHFSGPRWDQALAKDWGDAYGLVAQVMADAADAESSPAWWDADVVAHDRRDLETAVLTIKPRQPLPYRAGQSVTVTSPHRPRVWRHYSPANAPRPDGTIDLHVRMAEAGDVSTALVDLTAPGDVLRLGPPVGDGLRLDETSDRRLLLLAGGTGLAPLKAIVDQVASTRPRPVTLYWGARTTAQLYDLDQLRAMAARHDWFELSACVEEPARGLLTGNPVDLSVRHGHVVGSEVYVCGPTAMVVSARKVLVEAGVDTGSIHYETYGSQE